MLKKITKNLFKHFNNINDNAIGGVIAGLVVAYILAGN